MDNCMYKPLSAVRTLLIKGLKNRMVVTNLNFSLKILKVH